MSETFHIYKDRKHIKWMIIKIQISDTWNENGVLSLRG